MTDIHDIKPILSIGFDLQWLYWPLIVLGLMVIIIVARRFWQKRKNPVAESIAVPPTPADLEAYQMLDVLAVDANLDPKQFYFRLSAIVRVYIERRFQFPAAEMTTEELLPRMDRLSLSSELIQHLKVLCKAAEPIKFARASATRESMAHDLVFARDFVRLTTLEEEPTVDTKTEDRHSGKPEGPASIQLPLHRGTV